ncbi:MAG: transposase [Planctomycetia bacterium]
MSLLHRFGSALNHHVHLHACATDGVFVPTGGGPPAFLPARPITQADLAALTEKVRRRVVRWFRMQRLLDADAAADMLARENSGFSVDASVRITPDASGVVELSPCDFLDRLADLVPPPRKHRHRLPT